MRTVGTARGRIGTRARVALVLLWATACADGGPHRADAGPEPDVYRPLDCTGVQLRIVWARPYGRAPFNAVDYSASGEPVQILPETSKHFEPRMRVELGNPYFFSISVYHETLATGRLPAGEFVVRMCPTPKPCECKAVASCTHPKDWEGPLPLGSWLQFSEASPERVTGEFWLDAVCEIESSRVGGNVSGCFDLATLP